MLLRLSRLSRTRAESGTRNSVGGGQREAGGVAAPGNPPTVRPGSPVQQQATAEQHPAAAAGRADSTPAQAARSRGTGRPPRDTTRPSTTISGRQPMPPESAV